MHLTDLTFKRLRVPEKGRITYSDDAVPGFGVRISASGVRSFILLIGRNRKRITIGRYPTITLAEARARARELIAARVLGKEETPDIKFEDAMKLFLASQYPKHSLKPKTGKEVERVLNRYFLPPFRYEVLSTITTYNVTAIIDRKRRTPSEARHAYGVIRHFFKWAEQRRYVTRSPCAGVEPPRAAPPRVRVLTRDELKAVLMAARASTSTLSKIIQLLILTGQRRGEIAGLRREWIDFDARTITFPPAITKNKRSHTIPFGPLAEAVLRSGNQEGLLFPARGTEGKKPFFGWSKCKPKFDKRCPLPHWTLHDLRRTFATNLAAFGTPIHVTEKLLNHVSGTMAGIVSVYQRHTYADEMREAVGKWEAYIEELIKVEEHDSSCSPPDASMVIADAA
ncbi:MAG TPA: tyrosine-type recombinase/integrase [Rhizomicrobium sp.]|nr:tyrosine-type recombinase/integrase [Rhizomicrobium sp.]